MSARTPVCQAWCVCEFACEMKLEMVGRAHYWTLSTQLLTTAGAWQQ